MRRLESEPYVYANSKGKRMIIVAVYVDNLLIFWEKEEDEKIKEALQKQFAMRDLGQAQEFLGIKLEINKKRKEITIHQRTYITRMLKKFQMSDVSPSKL